MNKKSIEYFLFFIMMYIFFPIIASALTCTYEAPADSNFSKAASIVCNLTESKKKCTITIGDETNKENILNWTSDKKTGFVTKDYIKYNNQCPSGLIFNQKKMAYKLYAIDDIGKADDIIDKLKLKKARIAAPKTLSNGITNCQYTFKSADNQYLYLKYSYSGKLEWTDKFYWFASNKEKNINVYTNGTKISDGAKIANSSKGFAGYTISHNIYDQTNFLNAFKDGKCEAITLAYYPDGSQKILSISSGAYGDTQPDDDGATYVKLIADKVSSDGEVIDDKTFEYSFDTLSTYLILGTKSNGSRYMRVKNIFLEKECETYFTDTRNDVACKIDDIQYIISKSEIEHLWTEKDDNLEGYELEENRIYFSAQGRDELIKETYSSNQVVVTDPTGTATSTMKLSKICKNNNAKRVMRFIGYLLIIFKIFVPILLIYSGVILFGTSLLNGDYDGIKKNVVILLKKFVIALIVFLVPTIVNFIFTLTEGSEEANYTYKTCRVCIFEPNKCKINSN